MRKFALSLGLLCVVPASALAQVQSDMERQIAQDRQAAIDRREQAARADAAQRDSEAQRQRARSEAAEGKHGFYRVAPATSSHHWEVGHWRIWAEPDGVCRGFNQWDTTRVRFWGFREKGSQLELFFSSDGPAQPQRLQMSFNDGGKFDYDARVERVAGIDSYVVALGKHSTAIFPNNINFEAFAGGTQIWSEREFNMSKVDDAMAKCVDWQYSH
ncbi:MAG: hypothetical protein H7315_01575 [Herminiimonas sp.]|nr:hypothetical protein [Herminiimonas sp.]